MSILASKKVQYLTFYIHLTDPDLVEQYQTQYPQGVNRGPLPAADEFSAPWRGYTEPAGNLAPFSWTPWSGYGDPAGPYPLDRAVFTRHTGGFLGIGGTDVKFYWMGMFVLAVDETDAVDPATGEIVGEIAQAQIQKRRWVEGFEGPGLGASNYVNQAGLHSSRDSSRHVGGMGIAFRGAGSTFSILTTKYDPAYVAVKNWERLYVRLRKKPTTGTTEFWRCKGFPSAGVGVSLQITTTGQLAVYSVNSSNAYALLGTVGQLEEWTERVDHNAWVKLDILHESDIGQVRVFMRGLLVFTGNYPTGTSSSSSYIGTGVAGNDLYLDIDDWISAEIPQLDGVESLTSKDFLAGSSVRLLRPSGFSASHNGAAWGAGDYRVLQQFTSQGFTPATIGSSTALAMLGVDTDGDVAIDGVEGNIGVAAVVVNVLSQRGTNSGQLGYNANGAGAVLAAIVEGAALASSSVLFTNADGSLKTLADCTPFELLYEKGDDAVACAVASLLGHVELVGKFDTSDYSALESAGLDPVVPGIVGQHNAPYPKSPWSLMGVAAPASAPYIVTGGTYVGNGTGQDLTFRTPVHWLWTRPVIVGDKTPFFWLSTMLASHKGGQQGIDAKIVKAEVDPTFNGGDGEDIQQEQYRVRIAGNNAQLNANGVTYQYIAVSDPGMRYLLCSQFSVRSIDASRVTHLINAEYLPEWAWVFVEVHSATATNGLYVKHKDQDAATLASASAVALANALTFGVGEITTQSALHGKNSGQAPIALAFWRTHDGNGDTGEPGVVNVGSYVGDGAASRTIALAPASGKRPMFAYVAGENGSSAFRDPSFAGTDSANQNGTSSATCITAGGVDQITVGVTLNAAGTRYVYFILFAADATAGNNGWGTNGENIPVEAWAPVDGPWPDDPPEPGDGTTPVTPPPPEIPDDITTDLTAQCEPFTRKIVNLALSRIGVNKQLTTSLATDTSQEATTARLHYANDVGRVLREFPWPFATRYANLVLVAGTDTVPVNLDWQYAYRAPTNMAFGRRIVPKDGTGRDFTPDPIRFRIGADDTGFLIYCNEPATAEEPLQLEYTLRMDCPASSGDALFRSALAWAHAASLAYSIARDKDKAKDCEAMYRYEAGIATATAANEQQPSPDGDASWISGRN